MARLFITEREIDYINDINSELVKDVIGSKIFYFPISATKSNVHPLYLESKEKVFDTPIVIDCLVKWAEAEVTTNQFTTERKSKVDVWISSRDMINRKIQIFEGDFFSYGQLFFEMIKVTFSNTIFGQVERMGGIHVVGLQARRSQFISKAFGPTWEGYSDPDAVQETFVQQRGGANRQGTTGDVRELIRKGVTDPALTGPHEVSGQNDTTGAGSSFYDE